MSAQQIVQAAASGRLNNRAARQFRRSAQGELVSTILEHNQENQVGSKRARRAAKRGNPSVRDMVRMSAQQVLSPMTYSFSRGMPFAPIAITHTYGVALAPLENHGDLNADVSPLWPPASDGCEAKFINCNDPNRPFGSVSPADNYMRWQLFWANIYDYRMVTHAKIKVTFRNDIANSDSTAIQNLVSQNPSTYCYLKLHAGIGEAGGAILDQAALGPANNNYWSPCADQDATTMTEDPAGQVGIIRCDSFRGEGKGGMVERMPLENYWYKKYHDQNGDIVNPGKETVMTGSWSLEGHEGVNPAQVIHDSWQHGSPQQGEDNLEKTWFVNFGNEFPKLRPKWYMWHHMGDATEAVDHKMELFIELEQTVLMWGFNAEESTHYRELG